MPIIQAGAIYAGVLLILVIGGIVCGLISGITTWQKGTSQWKQTLWFIGLPFFSTVVLVLWAAIVDPLFNTFAESLRVEAIFCGLTFGVYLFFYTIALVSVLLLRNLFGKYAAREPKN